MEFKDRIKQRMIDEKLKPVDLVSAVKVSKTTISFWLAGTNKARGKNLLMLAKALRCNPTWLETGKGEMQAGQSNVEPGPEIKGFLPLISWIQAGAWCEVEDVYAVGEAEEWMPCPNAHGPRTYVLRVRGESMWNIHANRSFRHGDLIFCDPDRQAENGSMVIVKLEDSQEATFKQLVIEGDQQFLKPLNPAWPEPIIKVNANANFCGVVIGKYEPY